MVVFAIFSFGSMFKKRSLNGHYVKKEHIKVGSRQTKRAHYSIITDVFTVIMCQNICCKKKSEDHSLILTVSDLNLNRQENGNRSKPCLTFEIEGRGIGGWEYAKEGSTSSEIRGILPSCFLWAKRGWRGRRLWRAVSWVPLLSN